MIKYGHVLHMKVSSDHDTEHMTADRNPPMPPAVSISGDSFSSTERSSLLDQRTFETRCTPSSSS